MSTELKLELWAERTLDLPNGYNVELSSDGIVTVKLHGTPIWIDGISGKESKDITEADIQTLLDLATEEPQPKAPVVKQTGIKDDKKATKRNRGYRR